MFLLILWIFVFLVNTLFDSCIVNLILRIRLHTKNVKGNNFQILIAALFIILAVVNIITTVIALDDKSAESETLVKTVTSDEELIQDEYYITDEGY